MKCMIIAALVGVALCNTSVFQSPHAPPHSHHAPPPSHAAPPPHNGYLIPGQGNGHGNGNGNGHGNGNGQGQIEQQVEILKDERTHEEDGTFSFDVAADNGYTHQESGQPSGPEGAVVVSGQYEYTAPDGTVIAVKYVADENGFVAESDALPVAPIFPHEVPEFVLEQIRFAAEEDKAAEEAGRRGAANGNGGQQNGAPSQLYGHPDRTTTPATTHGTPPNYLYGHPDTTTTHQPQYQYTPPQNPYYG